jgi:hypothetical protein
MSFRQIASQFKRTHAFRKTSVVYVPSQGWYHDACIPEELIDEAQPRTLDDVIDAVDYDGEFPTCDDCNKAFFEDLGTDSWYHTKDDLRLISRHKTAASRKIAWEERTDKIAWESSYRTDTGDEIIAYVSSLYDSGELARSGWSSREERDAITKVVADNFPKNLLNKVTDADMEHLEDENCGAAMRAIAYLRPEFSNWVESDNMSTYASRKTAGFCDIAYTINGVNFFCEDCAQRDFFSQGYEGMGEVSVADLADRYYPDDVKCSRCDELMCDSYDGDEDYYEASRKTAGTTRLTDVSADVTYSIRDDSASASWEEGITTCTCNWRDPEFDLDHWDQIDWSENSADYSDILQSATLKCEICHNQWVIEAEINKVDSGWYDQEPDPGWDY